MTNYSDAAQSAKRSREYKMKLEADLREALTLLREVAEAQNIPALVGVQPKARILLDRIGAK